MLSFTGGLKVLVALDACDMRKGFNGLEALVSEKLQEDVKWALRVTLTKVLSEGETEFFRSGASCLHAPQIDGELSGQSNDHFIFVEGSACHFFFPNNQADIIRLELEQFPSQLHQHMSRAWRPVLGDRSELLLEIL